MKAFKRMAGDGEFLLDGRRLPFRVGQTVLDVARGAGLDIPTLCFLEKCGPLNTCQVCLVKIDGKLVPSCGTKVRAGMVVESETEEVHEARRTALELLFSDHVGDCLAPCQRLCPLGLNIPLLLRQVQSEAAKVEAMRTVRGALPLAGVLGHLCHHPCEQGCRRGHWDDPAAIRDIERFVSALSDQETAVPPSKGDSGWSVVVAGAGPVGLGAAYSLALKGHRVTVLDRHARPGGALGGVSEAELPPAVLDQEVKVMEHLGISFRLNTELGSDISIDQLGKEFDAVIVATGTPADSDAERIGLPLSGSFLKVDPNTLESGVEKVFVAGAATRSVRQLVRAVAEGKAVAECVDLFLRGKAPRRPERPFSNVMGRLQPGEIKAFLLHSNMAASVTPCNACAGLNRAEAAIEGSRCLHCDCRSSGNCLLQHYAQSYNVDGSRFRAERRQFLQQVQPGGIVFEPGKCILCGICVKLTELAAEPLGLTFVGRGFDVRVAAPLNHSIEEGLRQTAAECVEHCPTGALAFINPPATPVAK